MISAAEPIVLTISEAAGLARISEASLRAAVVAGAVQSVKIGRRVLIPRAKFVAFLEGEAHDK